MCMTSPAVAGLSHLRSRIVRELEGGKLRRTVGPFLIADVDTMIADLDKGRLSAPAAAAYALQVASALDCFRPY